MDIGFQSLEGASVGADKKADVFKTKADAARANAGSSGQQALMPIDALSDALVNTFIEDGSLPGLQAAIDEYGKLAEQDPNEAAEEAAMAPTAGKTEAVGNLR